MKLKYQIIIGLLFIILFMILIFKILPDIQEGSERINQERKGEQITECINGCVLASEIVNDYEILYGGDCWDICEENIEERLNSLNKRKMKEV